MSDLPAPYKTLVNERLKAWKGETEASPIWRPHHENVPQQKAYTCEAFELLFGGSAGGGKSSLLLGLALTAHRKSIFFRREYPQLTDIILESRRFLIGTNARFNGQSMMWQNIPGNRILEFGAVQHEDSVEKYRGRSHDLKAFDEICGFTESQYLFLMGWARSTVRRQRVRVVAAGNPPSSAEGEWVIKRWGAWLDKQHPNPAKPEELRWYARIDGEDKEVENANHFEHKGQIIIPQSRTFIPARLSDNPFYAQTDYESVIQQMPEPLRSQMLYGDFSIGIESDRRQLIPTEWVDAAQKRWREGIRPDTELSAIGCDVARGGKDQSTVAKRYNHWYDHLIKVPGKETPDGNSVASLVMNALESEDENQRGSVPIHIDLTGVGSSPYDILVANGFFVYAFVAAEKSNETDRSGRLNFINRRSEIWWKMREALDLDYGADIAIPPDTQLRADLTAPRWELTARGIQVESKDKIYERLKRSTDAGDAVVLALQTSIDYVRFL